MSDLMSNLNPEQLKAVMHKDGPFLIVAGAGTGKTTVITQRIAYMIEQNWAEPEEILALTFTEKAAGEMEERVDSLLPIGYLDLWISTFHSFGEKILRAHGLDIGLPADFKLLNEFEQYAMFQKNLDKFDLDYYKPAGNPTKFIRAMLSLFSRAKDEDISPRDFLNYAEELRENMDGKLSSNIIVATRHGAPNVPPHCNAAVRKALNLTNFCDSEGNFSQEIAEQEVLKINELANAYHTYQQLLLDNSALDFGDLISYAYKLFKERPAILEKYRKQFKYILVDEFQDTNWAQYELIKMLSYPKNNLTVCADDDQSIYRFRGASMSNVMSFTKDYPQTQKVVLTKNYRSRQNILDLSYEFIKLNNPNRLEFQLAKADEKGMKLNKKLIAQNEGAGVIEMIEGQNIHDEIRLVVEKIVDLKIKDASTSLAQATRWNDFAILVRANDSAKEFINYLDSKKLPYQYLASRGLYIKPIVMDVIAYFKLLDNYHENSAMYRIFNIPVFDFTYSEIVNLNYQVDKKTWSLYEVLKNISALNLGDEIKKKADKVLSLIEKHTQSARNGTVSEVMLAFLNDSGYLQYLVSQEEKKSLEATALLNKFYRRIQEFEASSDDKSVKSFLAELNLEIDAGEEGSLPVDTDTGPEAIKIMTVHAAKGLEFKYAFIANMVDKRFPTIERRDLISLPDALIKEILPEGDVHIEEERRLFYVAMTRAKEHLYFSWAPDYGGVRKKKPSRFLVELGLTVGACHGAPVAPHCNAAQQGNATQQGNVAAFDNLLVKEKKSITKNDIVTIEIPKYFSFTQLAAYKNCPYQYRFAHILKIPTRGKAQFTFGKIMHGTLESVFKILEERNKIEQGSLFGDSSPSTSTALREGRGRSGQTPIELDEILHIYEGVWIDEWFDSKKQKEDYRKKGRDILKAFYEKYKDAWPDNLMLEKEFNAKIKVDSESVTIRGKMDRVDQGLSDTGKIRIIDYKTGAPKEKLDFDEKHQLLLYQYAAKQVFRQEVESLVFYYLENNSSFEFLGTDKDIEKMLDKTSEIIRGIKKGEFSPEPGMLCKSCDFKGICEFRKI